MGPISLSKLLFTKRGGKWQVLEGFVEHIEQCLRHFLTGQGRLREFCDGTDPSIQIHTGMLIFVVLSASTTYDLLLAIRIQRVKAYLKNAAGSHGLGGFLADERENMGNLVLESCLGELFTNMVIEAHCTSSFKVGPSWYVAS